MAKFSISVPDPEWEQARAVEPGLNASQLVQTALRHLIESRAPKPSFARQPPAEARSLVANARDALAVEARRWYERGYTAAANMATSIGWEPIDQFAEVAWDFNRWLSLIREDPEFRDTWDYVADSLTDGTGRGPGTVWELGFTDGLRAVWRAVVEDHQSTPESAITGTEGMEG